MNREIKFRGWDEDRKEMYNGDFIEENPAFTTGLSYGHLFIAKHDPDWRELTLMQYTGLKDKNGKEIYEGDIMKWESNGNCSISFVVWCLDRWRFNSYMGMGTLDLYPYVQAIPSRYPKAEVIGNIYENPELLSSELGAEVSDTMEAK